MTSKIFVLPPAAKRTCAAYTGSGARYSFGAALFAGAVLRQRGAAQHGASAGNGARRQQPTLRSRHLTGHAVDVVAMPAGVVSGSGITTRRLRWRCGARRVNAGLTSNGAASGKPSRMARISSWRSGITRHERLAAKLLQGGLLLLLLAAICLGGYSSLLSHQLASARQQAAELQKARRSRPG